MGGELIYAIRAPDGPGNTTFPAGEQVVVTGSECMTKHDFLIVDLLVVMGERENATGDEETTNWLLAWLAQLGEPLPEQGPLGPELPPPADPVQGHPGDLPVG